MLARLFAAHRVNLAHLGSVIGAWEVDDLPDDWLDAFGGVVDDLPAVQRKMKAHERQREKWREELKKKHGGALR